MGKALQPGLLAVSDLLADEQGEEVAVGPGLLLGLADDLHVDTSHVRQVQAAQEGVELLLGQVERRAHWITSVKLSGRCSACST